MVDNLPDIKFVDTSAADVENYVLTTYQELSGRTLAKGDPVRLFLLSIASVMVQQRVLIDQSAKQNLLAYATSDFLDHIGFLVGTFRLPATKAKTTLRFTLSALQNRDVAIPAGTRVASEDNVIFATLEDVIVPAGQITAETPAQCTGAGSYGNDLLSGAIAQIVDPFPWYKEVTNITTSEGGADVETDDAFRLRIRQAPERFSTAGPDGAYEYWAKSTNQNIIDVAVYSPSPGEVEIRPLMTGGELPDTEILDLVAKVCNDKTIRPLTDKVTVLAPEIINYDLNLTYYIDRKNVAASLSIKQNIDKAVNDFVLWQKSQLGRDINPSELISRIMIAGAKRVEVLSPAFTVLENWQVAVANEIFVTYGGLENG